MSSTVGSTGCKTRNFNIKIRSLLDKLKYEEAKDQLICPIGEPMKNIGWKIEETKGGYAQMIDKYQARNCNTCLLKGTCHQQAGDRISEISLNSRRLKQQADKRLKSKKGIQKRKQRCHDVEPVFANIKHNHQFKRFMLRGKEKVSIELGLLALAHNLRRKRRKKTRQSRVPSKDLPIEIISISPSPRNAIRTQGAS